jgi:hypothetical protein
MTYSCRRGTPSMRALPSPRSTPTARVSRRTFTESFNAGSYPPAPRTDASPFASTASSAAARARPGASRAADRGHHWERSTHPSEQRAAGSGQVPVRGSPLAARRSPTPKAPRHSDRRRSTSIRGISACVRRRSDGRARSIDGKRPSTLSAESASSDPARSSPDRNAP